MGYYTIKIIRVGQPTIEVTADATATVKSVLEAAGVNTTGANIRFNGTAVSMTSKFTTNGDLVISKAVAGA